MATYAGVSLAAAGAGARRARETNAARSGNSLRISPAMDILREVVQRVHHRAADPQLEVEVGTGAVAGATDGADLLALAHCLALAPIYGGGGGGGRL